MSDTAAITEIEARAARAEAAALESQIRLAIVQDRLADVEAAAARRNDAQATAAVRQLVTRGAIRRDDVFNHHILKSQFLADAALIPLAVGPVFNQKRKRTM